MTPLPTLIAIWLPLWAIASILFGLGLGAVERRVKRAWPVIGGEE